MLPWITAVLNPRILEAMRVAESWGVAQRLFDACVGSDYLESFPHFAPLAETNKDALEFAASFCEQVCAVNKLDPDVGRRWLEEFQADLMASKMMLIAIAEGTTETQAPRHVL